jgi:hypothetical protein
MAAERPFDRYQGPNCTRPKDGALLRPLNYLLLRESRRALTIEIRGFCHADEPVRTLASIQIPLVAEAGL